MNKSRLGLIAIILVSAFIRFYSLDHFAGFDYDQETAVGIAQTILHGRPVLIGQEISAGGIFTGPFFNYLMAILLLVAKGNPSILFWFQALIGTISIYLCFRVGESYSKNSGLITAFIYAFSLRILAIDHSFNPSTLIPFLTLLGLFFFTSPKKSPHQKLILTSLIAGVASQLHPAGAPLLVLPAILILGSRLSSRSKLTATLVAFFSFVIWFTPLIIFDLRHDFLNTRHLLSLSQNLTYPLVFRLSITTNLLFTLAVSLIRPGLISIIAFVIALPAFGSTWAKSSPLIALFAANLLLFSFYQGPVQDYYLFPGMIAMLLALSLGLARQAQRFLLVRPALILIAVIFFATTLTNLNSLSHPFSLHDKKQVIAAIKQVSDPRDQVTIHIDADLGQNNGFTYLAAWQQLDALFSFENPDFIIYIPKSRGENGQVFGNLRLVSISPNTKP